MAMTVAVGTLPLTTGYTQGHLCGYIYTIATIFYRDIWLKALWKRKNVYLLLVSAASSVFCDVFHIP